MPGKQNRALWAVQAGKPLEIKSAPYPTLKPNYIIIKTRAVAINPIDVMLPQMGANIFPWLKFPFIGGGDLSGDVLEVGSEVTRLKPGDRVVGIGLGFTNGAMDPEQAAFQEHVLVREDMCAPIPASMSHEKACVIPLGLCVAATGLYMKNQLNLPHPKIGTKSTGRTLLIWGGSTSVGTNAIQLAKASGYNVITTCSPHNFELVKNLGASQAFDYNSPTVVQDIVKALADKDCAGAQAIGAGAILKCLDILAKLKKTDKFISMVSYAVQPPAGGPPKGAFALLSFMFGFFSGQLSVYWKCFRYGLKTKFVFATDLEENEVGPAVWKDFLGDALANGSFVPSPEPLVVPAKGLEGIEEGFKMLNKGVSAKKVVVTIS